MTKPVHLLPFYVKETTQYESVPYIDLSKDTEALRGMECVKAVFPADIPIYRDGKQISNVVYYWRHEENKSNVFDNGFALLANTKKEVKVHPSMQKYLAKKNRK